MTADPEKRYEDDATDEGVSNTDPAEGGEPAGNGGSPEGVITGETADER